MNRNLIMSGVYQNHVPFEDVNHAVQTDPKGLVDECEHIYACEIERTAQQILSGISRSRIVMLAGPSGSGKTTTAKRLCSCLEQHGVKAHTIELDCYYRDVEHNDPSINYEEPERLDLSLIIEQMDLLSAGEDIWLPKFDFVSEKQHKNVTHMKLQKDEIAIFEGIHALNDIFRQAKANPIDLYISPRLRIIDSDGQILMRPDELRFIRRGIRDMKYRGADFHRTLSLWDNVIAGVQAYIMPFKKYADIIIDTSFDYEVNLLAQYAISSLETIDEGRMTALEMPHLRERLMRFEPLDPSYVPENSMLREFFGKIGLEEK